MMTFFWSQEIQPNGLLAEPARPGLSQMFQPETVERFQAVFREVSNRQSSNHYRQEEPGPLRLTPFLSFSKETELSQFKKAGNVKPVFKLGGLSPSPTDSRSSDSEAKPVLAAFKPEEYSEQSESVLSLVSGLESFEKILEAVQEFAVQSEQPVGLVLAPSQTQQFAPENVESGPGFLVLPKDLGVSVEKPLSDSSGTQTSFSQEEGKYFVIQIPSSEVEGAEVKTLRSVIQSLVDKGTTRPDIPFVSEAQPVEEGNPLQSNKPGQSSPGQMPWMEGLATWENDEVVFRMPFPLSVNGSGRDISSKIEISSFQQDSIDAPVQGKSPHTNHIPPAETVPVEIRMPLVETGGQDSQPEKVFTQSSNDSTPISRLPQIFQENLQQLNVEWVTIREFVQNLKQPLDQLPIAMGIEPETGTLLLATPEAEGTSTVVQSSPDQAAGQAKKPSGVYALKETGFLTQPVAKSEGQLVSQSDEPVVQSGVQKDPGKVSGPIVRMELHQPVSAGARVSVSEVFEAYPSAPVENSSNALKPLSLQPVAASSTGVMLEQFLHSLNVTQKPEGQPVWQSVLLQSSQSSDLTVKQKVSAPQLLMSSEAPGEQQQVQQGTQTKSVSSFSPVAAMSSGEGKDQVSGFVRSGPENSTRAPGRPGQNQSSPAGQFSGQVTEIPAEQQQVQSKVIQPTSGADAEAQSPVFEEIPFFNNPSSNRGAQPGERSTTAKPTEALPEMPSPKPVNPAPRIAVSRSTENSSPQVVKPLSSEPVGQSGNTEPVTSPAKGVIPNEAPSVPTSNGAVPKSQQHVQSMLAEMFHQQQSSPTPVKMTVQPVEIVLEPVLSEVSASIGKPIATQLEASFQDGSSQPVKPDLFFSGDVAEPVAGTNSFVVEKKDGVVVQQPEIVNQNPANAGSKSPDTHPVQNDASIQKSTLSFEEGMDFERMRPVLIRSGEESVAMPGTEKGSSPVMEKKPDSGPVFNQQNFTRTASDQNVTQQNNGKSSPVIFAGGTPPESVPQTKPERNFSKNSMSVNTGGGSQIRFSTVQNQASSKPSQQPAVSQPNPQLVQQAQAGQELRSDESLQRELLYPEQDFARIVGKERSIPEPVSPEPVSQTNPAQPSTTLKAPESAGVSTATAPDKPQQLLPPNPVEQVVQTVRTGMLEGRGEMELQLAPDELGRLRIRVSVEDGRVTARIVTESREARAMLESNLPDLRLALGEQGLRVHEVKLSQAGSSVGDELTGGSSFSFSKGRQNFADPQGQPASDGWSQGRSNSNPSEETTGQRQAVALETGTAPVLAGRIDFRA